MTYQDECSVIRNLVDLAMEHGPDAMAAAFATLMNHAMQIEREQVLKAEPYWRGFLESLQKRGMHGVKLVVSDDHAGLWAARQAVMAGLPWQRCQFHTIRNAIAHVPKVAMRSEVARDPPSRLRHRRACRGRTPPEGNRRPLLKVGSSTRRLA